MRPSLTASPGVTCVSGPGAALRVLLRAVGAGCAGVVHDLGVAVDVGAQTAVGRAAGVVRLRGEAGAGVQEVLVATHLECWIE